jgi:hypothetical protein
MTLNELKAMLDEACLDEYRCGCYSIDDIDYDDVHGLEVVEEGDWVQDYKSQYCTTIVKDNEGNYFQLDNNRQGSYHTDWYYGVPSVSQVKRVEKVVTKTVVSWEAV